MSDPAVKQRILLVGANGFIGRHLCTTLSGSGLAVTAASSSDEFAAFVKEHAPDIEILPRSEDLVAAANAATHVFYLSHRSQPATYAESPASDTLVNFEASGRFFEGLAISNPRCQVVYASSGGQVYGRSEQRLPNVEDGAVAPVTAYGMGKLVLEQFLQFLERRYGLQSTILRMANPIGRWQLGGTHGLVAAAVRCAVTGGQLTVYGDGTNTRDYFDVADLCRLMVALISAGPVGAGTYNIGSGIGRTERDIIAVTNLTLGTQLKVQYLPARPFDLPYSVLNIDRARSKLGWEPNEDLTPAIADMANSLKSP